MQQRLIGVNVELLLNFALHVGFAGGAERVEQAGAANAGLNHFRGQRDAGKEPGKSSARAGADGLLLLHDVLLYGDDHGSTKTISDNSAGGKRYGKSERQKLPHLSAALH